MKVFTLPILPINLERNTDKKMADRGIDGIELEYPWSDYRPRDVFSGAFIAAGTDGLAISFCTEIPNNKVTAKRTQNKTKVYDDDCLEIFVRPSLSSIYYGWEINPNGACLDYRVGIGDDGIKTLEKSLPRESKKNYEGEENVRGLLYRTVVDQKLLYDYSWESHCTKRFSQEDDFWYLELFIPWYDFGLDECPKSGTVWHMTINRIDQTGYIKAAKKLLSPNKNLQEALKETNQGLQCLLDEVESSPGAFHQPSKFAEFTFTQLEFPTT